MVNPPSLGQHANDGSICTRGGATIGFYLNAWLSEKPCFWCAQFLGPSFQGRWGPTRSLAPMKVLGKGVKKNKISSTAHQHTPTRCAKLREQRVSGMASGVAVAVTIMTTLAPDRI